MQQNPENPSQPSFQAGSEAERSAMAYRYIRDKVNQLLTVMGTLPLNPEELDDATLIALDPIGIIAESFAQVLAHLHETNEDLAAAKEEIHKVLDAVGTAVVVVDHELRLVSYNRKSRETILNHPEAREGKALCELFDQQQCAYREMFSRILASHSSTEFADIEVKDQHYHVIATPVVNSQGAVVRVIFSFSDITRRKAIEDKLRQSAVVFQNSTEGFVITDADRRIIAVNEAFTRITGYAEAEVLGQEPSVLRSGKHDQTFYEVMWRDIHTNGSWRGEIWDRRKDGEILPLLQSISQVTREDGSVSNYVSIMTDITQIKETQQSLNFLAYHDPLTALPNRLLFNERLEHAIQLAARDNAQLAVIFLDLDRFKTVNDSLGHQIGDDLLVATAKRLSALFRSSDTVARLGGDEFIILLEDIAGPQEVAVLCRSLLQAFEPPFAIDGHVLHITPSMGVSMFPRDGDDVETLVKNADAAMYRAKEEGRNEFQFFTEELSAKAYERLTLEASLRQALEQEQLRLYYQPIVSLRNNHVVGAEALLRWEHPDMGLVPPDKFIPLAEETGLILPIGEWVLQQACRQAQVWIQHYPWFQSVSVNISGRQFQNGRLVRTVESILASAGLPACHLDLEITESYLMQKAEQTAQALDDLKRLGLSVSIDDFGTGYSSLSYLKRFAVDKLKIDRSFVRDVTADADDEAIAKAVIALGHSLQLQIVAEGVETPEQREVLLRHGCDLAQGYLFSRPLPASQLEQYFNDAASVPRQAV